MIRLFVPDDLAAGAELSLDEGRSRYLAAVMRLAAGDELLVFNGRDGEWLAGVAAVGKRTVTLLVRRQSRPQAVGPDLDLVVCHQANMRINEYVRDQLGLPAEKVPNNIQKYGNTTAATIPILLSELERDGRLKVGMKVALVAFGSGFTWGSAYVVW